MKPLLYHFVTCINIVTEFLLVPINCTYTYSKWFSHRRWDYFYLNFAIHIHTCTALIAFKIINRLHVASQIKMTKPYAFFFPFLSQFVKGLIVEVFAYSAKILHLRDVFYSESFCKVHHLAFQFDCKDKQNSS